VYRQFFVFINASVVVASKPFPIQALKSALFVLALLPFLRLAVGAFGLQWFGGLGTNPVELITRSTGTWTLVFLCITLSVTPLRQWTGWHWLAQLRRMLGLFTFFYATCHFFTFIWFDHFFDVGEIAKDIVKRPFVTVGFLAWLLLVPLAATSFNRAIKAMGARNWQRLHKLVYLIAILGVVHYWWLVKLDLSQPILYGVIVAVLLGVRVVRVVQQKRAAPT
jgi:methionine sulfoxide reductase heme-binding subunit